MKKMNQVACGPEGIRVWQGYRSENYLNKRDRFIDKLGELFIPATVQMMEPIGLAGYFPTILPDTNFKLPDEIAMVIYESQEDYLKAAKTNTAGRAYGALHGTVFNFSRNGDIPHSKSDFPQSYQSSIEFGQPYFLCDQKMNWRDGKTKTYIAKRSSHVSIEEFKAHIEKVIPVWKSQNVSINGSILVCEEDFILYWEHSQYWGGSPSLSALFPFFAPVLDKPIIAEKPILRTIPALNTMDYEGLKVGVGDNLDIRLLEKKTQRSPITTLKYAKASG